ncbi:MAG: hypothetical protein ACYC9Q_14410 [Bacillota bacterium]
MEPLTLVAQGPLAAADDIPLDGRGGGLPQAVIGPGEEQVGDGPVGSRLVEEVGLDEEHGLKGHLTQVV